MDWTAWTFAALGLVFAGVVKGTTGVGYATCALPIAVYFVGLKPAMALILAPTLATNLSVAVSADNLKRTTQKFAPLYMAMIPGVGAGVWLLSIVDAAAAGVLLGGVMISYSLYSLAKPTLTISQSNRAWLAMPVGFVTGVITGLTGSQVFPLVPFFLAMKMDSEETIHAINVGVLLLTTLLGLGLLAMNLLDATLLQISILAVLPSLIGAEIGNRLRAHLQSHHLRNIVLIIVGLMGCKMALG